MKTDRLTLAQGRSRIAPLQAFVSAEIASKANKWAGRNVTRWRNEEYDRLWKAAESEMDPVKRAVMFVRMNDLLIQNVVVIPIIWRNRLQAVSNRLQGDRDQWLGFGLRAARVLAS